MNHFKGLLTQFGSNLSHDLKAMASPNHTSLSARSSTPAGTSTPPKKEGIEHAPAASNLIDAKKQLYDVRSLNLMVSSWDPVKTVTAYLHVPQGYRRSEEDCRHPSVWCQWRFSWSLHHLSQYSRQTSKSEPWHSNHAIGLPISDEEQILCT